MLSYLLFFCFSYLPENPISVLYAAWFCFIGRVSKLRGIHHVSWKTGDRSGFYLTLMRGFLIKSAFIQTDNLG